jgi:hypothetical protein
LQRGCAAKPAAIKLGACARVADLAMDTVIPCSRRKPLDMQAATW